MRVTLLHNPGAGPDELDGGHLTDLLADHGYEATYVEAVPNRFESALQDPGEFVIVAGGDGTLHAIAPLLADRGIPMAILPEGTANNIARTLGSVGTTPELVAGWTKGHRRPVDIGFARGPWGEQPFLESVGVGFFPQMLPLLSALKASRTFPSREAQLEHDLAFMHRMLLQSRPMPWTVLLDGEDLSGEYLLVEILNTSRIGPGLHLAPEADPGDGRLDVALVDADRQDLFAEYLRHGLDEDPPPAGAEVRRAEQVELVWEGAPIHVDSTVWAAGNNILNKVGHLRERPPIHIQIGTRRHALEVLVPE